MRAHWGEASNRVPAGQIAGNLLGKPVKLLRVVGIDVNATIVVIVRVCSCNKVETALAKVLIVILMSPPASQAVAVVFCALAMAKSKVASIVQLSHVGEVHICALEISTRYVTWNDFGNMSLR